MIQQLDEEYFTWLYSWVGSVKLRNRARSHTSLCRDLYKKEFLWIIPNDDNRAADGVDFRYQFLKDMELEPDEVSSAWLDMSCSMLELLLGLALRLSFEAEGEPRVWFWHLVETLDLAQYNDRVYDDYAERKIDEALDRIIWRTYRASGEGGLFPLLRPKDDQTEVELWYQLSAYLLELP